MITIHETNIFDVLDTIVCCASAIFIILAVGYIIFRKK